MVVREVGEAVIVANAECDDSVRRELAEGVGFPRKSFFEFDAALSDSFAAAWEAQDAGRLLELWRRATPCDATPASRG